MAEGFSSLLRQAGREKKIYGVAIARGAPSVSHLIFADDSFLFCDASVADCTTLTTIFRRYEKAYEEASGQMINRDKSAMCFSPKTSSLIKEDCCNVLDMPVVPYHEPYLGLPMVMERHKKTLFRSLSNRVWNRIHGWEGKLLSKAGKEVLIKLWLRLFQTIQ